uniref:DPPIV_N domain-containing protein n=2 Tax=Mesocestoides corti TaxID=53468 RepID=A0A5K3ESC2_MESCO
METSPWDASANLEVHIVANVSIVIHQWLISTAGKDPKTSEGLAWYDAKGRQLLDSIARFWSVRVDYSEEKSAYVIKGELLHPPIRLVLLQ